jgi:hypothetical protein
MGLFSILLASQNPKASAANNANDSRADTPSVAK